VRILLYSAIVLLLLENRVGTFVRCLDCERIITLKRLAQLICLLAVFASLHLWGMSCTGTPSSEKTQQQDGGGVEKRPEKAVEVGPEPTQEAPVETNTEKAPEKTAPLCQKVDPVKPTKDFFVDISRQSGIQDGNFLRTFSKKVPINDHSRLAFADINGDGFDDIVAHSLYPNAQAGIPFQHLVFINNGDGTFKNFSDESGLRNVQAAFFAFADIDNDGDQDCFAGLDIPLGNNTNQIYLNDGKGHFTRKANAGVEVANLFAANAVFADFNNDGKLDLYVGAGGTTYRMKDAFFLGNGDGTFSNATSRLYGNSQQPTNGTVTCDFDNDGDLDIIVSTYSTSTLRGANILWQNDGKGNFNNVARKLGFEALATGNYYLSATGFGQTPEPGKNANSYIGSNGFGIDCKDVNNDGNYDIFLTTISHPNVGVASRQWSDPTQLLINLGASGQFAFKNEFLKRKLPFNEGDVDGAMHDFDNDGRIDLSVSRENKYEKSYNNVEQKGWFGLFHQQPDGSFKSLVSVSGINRLNTTNSASLSTCDAQTPCPTGETCLLSRCRQACTKDDECTSKDDHCASYWDAASSKVLRFCRSSLQAKGVQNHAWADIDHDGDLDLLIGGRDKGGGRPNFLYRNDIGSKNRWLALRMFGDGKKINRDAIGARVSLLLKDGKVITREVQSSRGMYNSMDTKILHFGLADFDCDYEIKIRWPNGETKTIPRASIKENTFHKVTYPNTLQ